MLDRSHVWPRSGHAKEHYLPHDSVPFFSASTSDNATSKTVKDVGPTKENHAHNEKEKFENMWGHMREQFADRDCASFRRP